MKRTWHQKDAWRYTEWQECLKAFQATPGRLPYSSLSRCFIGFCGNNGHSLSTMIPRRVESAFLWVHQLASFWLNSKIEALFQATYFQDYSVYSCRVINYWEMHDISHETFELNVLWSPLSPNTKRNLKFNEMATSMATKNEKKFPRN